MLTERGIVLYLILCDVHFEDNENILYTKHRNTRTYPIAAWKLGKLLLLTIYTYSRDQKRDLC